jgi:hypothetical protein
VNVLQVLLVWIVKKISMNVLPYPAKTMRYALKHLTGLPSRQLCITVNVLLAILGPIVTKSLINATQILVKMALHVVKFWT